MPTDYELLDAWAAGDRSAGNELFDRYFPSVFGFFRSKVGDKAEDLAQQTFLNITKSIDGFRRESSFRSYLFSVARNRLYNYLKREQAQVFDGGVTSCADLGLSPSMEFAKSEEHALLLRALRALPLDFQVALELFYFEQMRGPELAAALDLPEGTVRSRIRRGRDALRDKLEELSASRELLESTMTNLEQWAEQVRDAALGDAD
ncbi:MAG: RNA polymerase sigma factor [Myxococcota bacterium]